MRFDVNLTLRLLLFHLAGELKFYDVLGAMLCVLKSHFFVDCMIIRCNWDLKIWLLRSKMHFTQIELT